MLEGKDRFENCSLLFHFDPILSHDKQHIIKTKKKRNRKEILLKIRRFGLILTFKVKLCLDTAKHS